MRDIQRKKTIKIFKVKYLSNQLSNLFYFETEPKSTKISNNDDLQRKGTQCIKWNFLLKCQLFQVYLEDQFFLLFICILSCSESSHNFLSFFNTSSWHLISSLFDHGNLFKNVKITKLFQLFLQNIYYIDTLKDNNEYIFSLMLT